MRNVFMLYMPPNNPEVRSWISTLLWLSALLTIYTGWDYLQAGLHHLTKEDA